MDPKGHTKSLSDKGSPAHPLTTLVMKRHVITSLMAAGLALLPFASANAFEACGNVGFFTIPGGSFSTPFIITQSGNYILTGNRTFTGVAGPAILVQASQVYIDLNGRTLSDPTPTNFAFGIQVFSQVDVTIEEGDIDGFFIGVFFAHNSEPNAKNTAENLKFNSNTIGVFSESATSNWIKDNIIDGGDVGVFLTDDAGTRVQNNIIQDQLASQILGLGIALVSTASHGNLFDNNEILKGSNAVGQFLNGTDKFRFESFVGFPNLSPHVGGTDELDGSL